MAERAPSLRIRLLAGTLAAVTIIWLASAGVAWREARHEAEEVFDAHLAQAAGLLLAYAGDEPDEIAEHLPAHRYARSVAFQFRDASGRLLARSPEAPAEHLSAQAEGFSDSFAGGERWRVFGLRESEHGTLVQVAESLKAREKIADEVASHLLQPLIFALPALALALAVLIGHGLRPLQRLAQEVGQRRSEDLAPLAADRRQPAELRPLVERLNQLFARVGASLEQERRFTADAAHELRTPLAAIRAHAQVAAAEPDSGARRIALDCVIAATDRATRLTAQLLTLARLDAQAWETTRGPCDLRALAADVLADQAPAALARGVSLELADDDPAVVVEGQSDLLRVLLRNLVENAVRHSPPGSSVHVRCVDRAGGPAWEVVDQGPGIPASQRARVCERFRRLEGAPEGGAGLGLSIALRIAELHRARIVFSDEPDGAGFCVGVQFPSQT